MNHECLLLTNECLNDLKIPPGIRDEIAARGLELTLREWPACCTDGTRKSMRKRRHEIRKRVSRQVRQEYTVGPLVGLLLWSLIGSLIKSIVEWLWQKWTGNDGARISRVAAMCQGVGPASGPGAGQSAET